MECSAQVAQFNWNNNGRISGEWGLGKERKEGRQRGVGSRAGLLCCALVCLGGWARSKQASRCQPGASLLRGEVEKGATLARRESSMMVQRAEVGLLLGL